MKEKTTSTEIHSKRVNAGKRAYFFDVKLTRAQDAYIVITESKRIGEDGQNQFAKSKLFLYKEDFEKFSEALRETVELIESGKLLEENS